MLQFTFGNAGNEVVCDLGPFDSWQSEYRKMFFSLLPIYAAALGVGALPVHAALIERRGVGTLVAAPGGTGKTTCSERLPNGWTALADDDTLLAPRRGAYFAHPFPTWSRYVLDHASPTWPVERGVPLAALFFLQQSEVDTVSPLRPGEVALLLYKSVTWSLLDGYDDETEAETRQRRSSIFNVACAVAASIPGFVLSASRTGPFWEVMDEAVRKITCVRPDVSVEN